MAFWNNQNVHPKTKSKFVLVIGSYMIPTVVSVTKPKVTIENKEYQMINHYYKYPGLAKWQPITITFVDGAGEIYEIVAGRSGGTYKSLIQSPLATADLLAGMLAKSGDVSNDGRSPFFDTTGNQLRHNKRITSPEKASMMDRSFGGDIRIQQLDSGIFGGITDDDTRLIGGDVHVTEEWTLKNPIISEIDWGSLAYGDDGLVEYSLTVDYDYAVMKSAGPNGAGNPAILGQYKSHKEFITKNLN